MLLNLSTLNVVKFLRNKNVETNLNNVNLNKEIL